MVKITKSNLGFRLFIFFLSSFLAILCLVYLVYGRHQAIDLIVCTLIIIGNLYLSYYISFNDYDVWFSPIDNFIEIRKGSETIAKYNVGSIDGVKIEHLGMNLSIMYGFYRLVINGDRYRIRYTLSEPLPFYAVAEPQKISKMIEQAFIADLVKYGYR